VTGNAVKLAPSILAANFAYLGDQVAEAARAGADRVHVDVMDGHFVPNLSMGPPIISSLRRVTHLPLEAHLMISNPDFFVDEFVQAGTDSFLVHWEGNNNLSPTPDSDQHSCVRPDSEVSVYRSKQGERCDGNGDSNQKRNFVCGTNKNRDHAGVNRAAKRADQIFDRCLQGPADTRLSHNNGHQHCPQAAEWNAQ
jgi:hypothetical protein